ncbi:hypothetical protein [Mycobacterium sp. OTB74]|jgi:hypothetical protein|uniref:hypothetical protein n=1 Tax=Mycobacterium sp. OTB74 TaxID=1853452 RepID=UPI002475B7CB|nr:hypothetical protein [Mycobacterium sp. OTB74]MDH6247264.1 hypothetical protein [Mycobacterium sp. OTB74]
MRNVITVAAAAVLALAFPGTAHADSTQYLNDLHGEYFSHPFTDAQLCSEGTKVCDNAGAMGNPALRQMVQSDRGVSEHAASDLAIDAHVYLGC